MSREFVEISMDERVGDAADLPWLQDHGVRIDHKGRIVVSLPPPEVQLSLLARDGDDPSIAELMRRDVDPRLTRARTRRRRAAKARSVNGADVDGEAARSVRCGRPTIGAEVRVRVHTTIAQRTQRILTESHVTFAEVLDECARELAHAS